MQEDFNKLDKGAGSLLGVHINALEENSKKVVEILERLSTVDLGLKEKRVLKRIKSELKGIDRRIDSIDRELSKQDEVKDVKKDEEDWFAF